MLPYWRHHWWHYNLVNVLLLICQGLQSNLLDCRLKTQTKREQYCCHIEDSFDSVITWLVLCYSSVKCSLDCMLMMQTCSQARKDKVRNSVIYNPGIHFACTSKQLIRLNVLFETNNISTMAMLKKNKQLVRLLLRNCMVMEVHRCW